MTNYDYLIIGGGMTAAAAVDGIRKVDPTGGIGMISTEPDAPYNRPPLSKALWKGKPLDSIWRRRRTKGWGCTWVAWSNRLFRAKNVSWTTRETFSLTKSSCYPRGQASAPSFRR